MKIWTLIAEGAAGVITVKLVPEVPLPIGETAVKLPNDTEIELKMSNPLPVMVTKVFPTHGPETGVTPVIPTWLKPGAAMVSAELA